MSSASPPGRGGRRSRDAFVERLGFPLDRFQLDALDALDQGLSLLVAAPTGSGKTVVAEYAVAKAIDDGGKAFYTTPLKALSNQKYADLCRIHGSQSVGLLTGDNSINGEAPVVVMTTEVLRNMIYAGSSTLNGLRYVVLDEVHYLQNPYRGAVWEEVIVHTPASADLVCLSATVSNAEQFAAWIETVRGATAAVIDEHRPVVLHHLYLVGDRRAERMHVLPTFVDGRPNPEASALDAARRRSPRATGQARRRLYTPRRTEVVELLSEESMLPAIYFIFSRAGCDDAVRMCLEEGTRLTTPEERERIREIAEAKVEPLSDDDLRLLGYGRWLTGMQAGVAPHHAGLVPAFKEAVEACFAEALVKVVFATETLALGINMPARTVVIERLSKFTGERHEPLSAGEYTQLTGRAGRRGIDDVGYGAVLWSPFAAFDSVAALASARSFELRSSFRPTFNMAANLVQRYRPSRAHHLLNLSFAQYRSDAEVVRLEAALERIESSAAQAEEAAHCELGDLAEYTQQLRASAAQPAPAARRPREEVRRALERLRPGDVLVVPGSAPSDRLAIISTARRKKAEVRVAAVTTTGRKVVLGSADFASPPVAAASIDLPSPYNPASVRFARAAATNLKRLQPGGEAPVTQLAGSRPRPEATSTRGAPRTGHPVEACPELQSHLRAAARLEELRADAERLKSRIKGRSESLARQFDRVLALLGEWGYVEAWQLTSAGRNLARIYHESDLLVAESLRRGLLDGLDASSLAALVSAFTFEQRGGGPARPAAIPTAELRRRFLALEDLAGTLAAAEKERGLPPTRPPDPGFMAMAHGWARGQELDRVLLEEDLSGGDFVRNVKQLVDLLRQLAEVAPDSSTAEAARRGAEEVFRGVVAASSVLSSAGEDEPDLEEPDPAAPERPGSPTGRDRPARVRSPTGAAERP